jgi:DNA-nicking Smr family endonuclease
LNGGSVDEGLQPRAVHCVQALAMKKSIAPPPSPCDSSFREAMRDVVPLTQPGRVEHRRPRPAPIPLQRLRDEQAALAESLQTRADPDSGLASGEELVYVREGVPAQVLRRLRRGHWVVQDDLDLHGMTSVEARAATVAFLAECIQRGVRCVRIVHGKGLRSRNREPVLKRKLGRWLDVRDEVLAYCEARPVDGGSGAVIVLLRG